MNIQKKGYYWKLQICLKVTMWQNLPATVIVKLRRASLVPRSIHTYTPDLQRWHQQSPWMLPLSGYEHCVAPVHHPWTTGQFQDGLYHNGVLVHLQALGVDALMFPQLAPQKLLGQNRKKKVTNGNIITLNSSLFLRCDLSTLVISFVLLYTHKAVFMAI